MNGFSLNINYDTFENKNLIKDINNFFMKLEEYPQIQFVFFENDFEQIKLLNIDFKKIKNAHFFFIRKNDYLKSCLSLFDESKNLEDLTLYLSADTIIEVECLEKINKFRNLKYLNMTNANLNRIFTLKLTDLKKLNISNCKNIAFDENIIYKIENLTINKSKIIYPKSLLIFPELKYISFDSEFFEKISFLDLKNSKKLETIDSGVSYIDIEKECLEKILDLNNLKSVNISYSNLNDKEIEKIKKYNLSVKTLSISEVDKVLTNLIKKFPNSNEIYYCPYNKTADHILEIKEDKNSKIDKITLTYIPDGILNCHSFESLKSLTISFYYKITNIEKIIPLFDSKCNVIFKSLRDLSIMFNYDINDEFLNVLKTNLDFIVYLDNFTLDISPNDISEICYYDFIKKALSKNINNLKIHLNYSIDNKFMTKEEIKKFSPHNNFIHHRSLSITLFKKNK